MTSWRLVNNQTSTKLPHVPHGIGQASPGRGAGPRVTVRGVWMDRYPVTHRQFKEFAKATGHVTLA